MPTKRSGKLSTLILPRQHDRLVSKALQPNYLVISSEPSVVWALPGYKPPSQSDPKEKNRYARSNERKKILNAFPHAESPLGRAYWAPTDVSRRLVVIASWKKKVYDGDNFQRSCKPLMDALKDWAIYDDDPAHIEARYLQFTSKNIETLVLVYPIFHIGSEVSGVYSMIEAPHREEDYGEGQG